MKKIFVYDLPTRFFHWFFAILFLIAFAIAKIVDDENPIFSYHMIAGLTIVFILVLRIIWGFIGTTYARFSSFKLNPVELIVYFKDAIVSKTRRYLSHNPASSYAIIIMFVCAVGLAITGFFMTTGSETDFFEETHELFANLFLITVIAHIAGILFHQLRHKDALWSSMFDGKKGEIEGQKAITNTRPVAGILFIILTLLWMGYLNIQYDRNTQRLDLLGTELQLGEEDHQEYESGSFFENDDHKEDEDDD